ncbi:hypothetical protein AtDm6_0394 [Acetobacter tropicalis]|nr:hypothetical protein AtDm6_0394 [Acetobacter tropicalis]
MEKVFGWRYNASARLPVSGSVSKQGVTPGFPVGLSGLKQKVGPSGLR